VPKDLQGFDAAKIPGDRAIRIAKAMKLFFYGMLAIVPALGILLTVPLIGLLQGPPLYASLILIPFLLFILVAMLFAYVNKELNTKLQLSAAYRSLKPVIDQLQEKPRALYVAKPTFGESLVTGVDIKEFAMDFPSQPYKLVYYYDGSVSAGIREHGGAEPFKGLRIRMACPLKRGKPGRYERVGSIYLPQWGFSGETEDLHKLRGKVDLSGLGLVDDEPEPSRIEFDFDEALIVLSLGKGAYGQAGKAVQKALELRSVLQQAEVIES